MEVAAAAVSFVGLAGPFAQGLKFLYDFTTDMKDCPKEIREMKTDIELVEYLIKQVGRQCKEREKLRESAALARAIRCAQESVEDLDKNLAAYPRDGKRKRFAYATKFNRTQKLRESLDRTKTIMCDLKSQLQSDLPYDIRDMSQQILTSTEKMTRDQGTHNRDFDQAVQKSEVQAKLLNDFNDRMETLVQITNETSTESLTDIKIMRKGLEHITDLLTETRISSPPTSSTSTPTALSREVSDISVVNSSQESTASSISSSQSIPRSVSQNARQPSIASKYPLAQFKDNQFQFLIALIFVQRASQRLACQRASECLAAYPTPEAFSKTSPEALSQYFDGLGLHKSKPPQLIKLAQAYIKDPPKEGKLRSKNKCPTSQISHLPQIGTSSVNAWLVYCCEKTDVDTEDKTLLEYMEYLRTKTENP